MSGGGICHYCQRRECECLDQTAFPLTFEPDLGLFVSPKGTVILALGALSGRSKQEKYEFGKRIEKTLNKVLDPAGLSVAGGLCEYCEQEVDPPMPVHPSCARTWLRGYANAERYFNSQTP